MRDRTLVLDANILVRAVLGTKVRRVIEANAETTSFLVPVDAFNEAAEHLEVLERRVRG